MYINPITVTPITVDGDSLERVDEFTYLRNVVSSDNAAGKDITARLGKAQSAVATL